MGQVSDILEGKGREVLRIDASATVYDAIVRMVEGNVGALLVYEGDRLAGIVTERDYLRRVTLQDRDERTTPVGEIMTPELVFVGPDASVEEWHGGQTDRRIRRHLLAVSDEREVVGIVSIGDVVKFQSRASRSGSGSSPSSSRAEGAFAPLGAQPDPAWCRAHPAASPS
jgi:CBS domain-containing protein